MTELSIQLTQLTRFTQFCAALQPEQPFKLQIVEFIQTQFGLTQVAWFRYQANQLVLEAAAPFAQAPSLAEARLVEVARTRQADMQATTLAVPLLQEETLLGVLALQSAQAFRAVDLPLYELCAAHLATVLQRITLQEQSVAAAQTHQTFYDITLQLNQATRLKDIITAILAPPRVQKAQEVVLLTYELEAQSQPDWGMCRAVWSAQNSPRLALGSRCYLPFNQLWQTPAPILVENVGLNPPLDEPIRQICEQLEVAAVVFIPLQIRQRWLGVIIIGWAEPALFMPEDERLFLLIASQAAVRVDNLLLLEATEQRANQLQWLASIEVALSQATTEEEILTAITLCFDLEQANFTGWLQYLDIDEHGYPVTLQNVAVWSDGLMAIHNPEMRQVYPLAALPLRQLWLDLHNEPLWVADVAQDSRLNEAMRQELARFEFQAFVLLPLWSNNRWQGLVLFGWHTPRSVAPQEQFYLRRLLEPLAAIVASRRARLAQAEILDLTQKLYQASLHLNASTHLQGLLAALLETLPLPPINRAILLRFDETTTPWQAQVIANWYRGDGPPPWVIGSSWSSDDLAALGAILSQEPLVLAPVPSDSLPPAAVMWLQTQQIATLVSLPLWVAHHQLGALWLLSEGGYPLTSAQLQPYLSLMGQIAVAVEHKLLLESAQARIQRERVLREITSQIRRAVDVETVMRTATRKVAQTFDRKVFVKLNDVSE